MECVDVYGYDIMIGGFVYFSAVHEEFIRHSGECNDVDPPSTPSYREGSTVTCWRPAKIPDSDVYHSKATLSEYYGCDTLSCILLQDPQSVVEGKESKAKRLRITGWAFSALASLIIVGCIIIPRMTMKKRNNRVANANP